METIAPEEKESEYAAAGTACHTIAERCLTDQQDAIRFLGEVIETKAHKIVVDEEIVNGAQEYVDYVRSQSSSKSLVMVERQFSLDSLDPPFDAGGTCDAIIYTPREKSLEVVDLKFGRGFVEVKGNPQLRTYALGAMLAHLDFNVDQVKATIVQPRAGGVRSETFHVADLIQWTADLMAAMRRSKVAYDEFKALDGSRAAFDAWAAAYLTPGACKFCRSEGVCPALKKKALAVASEKAVAWFEDPTKIEPVVLPAPEVMPDEMLEHTLDGLDMLESWVAAVRARAHTRAEHGALFKNWVLVDKIGNRAWKNEDEAQKELEKLGVGLDKMHVKKLISPAQADKILGKQKAKIEGLYENPVRGTNLVRKDKTTRAAAKNKIEQHFEEPAKLANKE